MALSFAKAAPLKPEIKLAQALSEFEAMLPDDQKAMLRTYRQSPPNPTDVMRFTAEIDRDASRNRKSRQCVGTRLTNVLHAVQQFSTVVDLIVGTSQSQIAGAIWGTVKISLQVASAISSYFDQLSTLFMRIGVTCPRYQDFGLLYPKSTRLQSALCEYFVVMVHLCKKAVQFLQKPFWSQLSSSILKPFELEFGSFQQDLENLACAIRDEVFLALNQAQQKEAKEMSRFRAIFSDTSTQEVGKARTWKIKEAELRFLDAFSIYNHEKSWKQARKQGNTNWICHDEGYKHWKGEKISSTLWCTGILGSGKTVLSANVVEDLKITTPAVVGYFFCRYDEAESLKTRTIMGSIARQMFDHLKSEIVDAIAEIRPDTVDTVDQILDYLQELLPLKTHKYIVIIDGLDECENKEARLLLQCLKQLLSSKQVFQVYCSSRPDVFRWAHTLLEPQWNVSMSQTSSDIKEYVKDTLVGHLESGCLSVSDPKIAFAIQDALLENAHRMFLWVAFQIDSICSQETDEAILTALEDLPKDLPQTFNRILRKLQHSNANPQFCRKIFDLVAAAQRPLTLEELREAVSVTPGETSWDGSKLVNDMLRTLLNSCGSLVAVDDEYLTVHLTHHSVKQYLLSKPMDSDMRNYHMDLREADLYMGNIIVTYLNFGVFDRQLAKTESKMPPEVKIQPSAILVGSLSRSNIANRLAVRLLKSRENSTPDIRSHLNAAAGISDESKEQMHPAHPFLPYAQQYWLFHTKLFNRATEAEYALWTHLIDGRVVTIELPWAPERWQDFGDGCMEWMIENEHWALIDRSLVEFAMSWSIRRHTHDTAIRLLLINFLEKKATKMNDLNISFGAAFFLASCLGNKTVVLLSLGRGADINAPNGDDGTALHVASISGDEEMARFLLENGADVNAEGGPYRTALNEASNNGDEEIVRLLLEKGADANATSRYNGTPLNAASNNGYEGIVRLLLENGADVNTEGGPYRTALNAASNNGYEEIVRLLLQNGADANATSGCYGLPLNAASNEGYEGIARLLLENGADANATSGSYGTALNAASSNGYEGIARLLLENGADVNAKERENYTALQSASVNGHKAIARLLLENGANPNAEGGSYGTALNAASDKGHEEIVRLLLDNGAVATDETMEASSGSKVQKVIRNALKSQSLLVRGPTPFPEE